MSSLNTSYSNQTPSNSNTPAPHDVLVSQATPLQSQTSKPQSNLDNEAETQENSTNTQYKHQVVGAINTDYESSAAEDYELYSSSRYEIAEHALLSYSRTNKLDKLQALLEAKFKNDLSLELNYKGQQKQNFSWSALHLACYFGHIQVVEQILRRKQFRDEIQINIQNNSGDTPLHKAALTKRAQIVQLLLSNGANVFIKNCDGLLAKQLTSDRHIFEMLEAAEQVDKIQLRRKMFKAVDNGDLKTLQEYFQNYGSYIDASRTCSEVNETKSKESDDESPYSSRGINDYNHSEPMSKMIDERGNTLLHLAAMRGFKAICVYLLEQGFDPYIKNNLGQTCLDLSSHQLRQLFIKVKPAVSQLEKLSRQRVTRFEGPLLKKVRILGWKQIYIVLENGVILLFNNRRDSMNKSRRGYKYLESATCEPDLNDQGSFTVCFSDKSRATFLVTSDHLQNYASFKTSALESDKSLAPVNQVELIRQKWIDSIRDHIQYSTDFIKNGLKLNDLDDEIESDNADLTTLNHLLPIDTIKSYIQEARAHYSILERHAESLCNLVQSINSSSKFNNSAEFSQDESKVNQIIEPQPTMSSSSTSSRFLGLMRPSRQNRGNSMSAEDGANSQTLSMNTNSTRRRNDSFTNDFIQDNWHCVLFHLRLLVESTQNTKLSMGQALVLMEHQEHLRQNRIQDQDERCRVLQDSLHALARDHHELEKSISMSQLYHSAAARSMSMSTDLNEYFDAFEEFDDEKTMTPTSMPSDEELNQKIQEVMGGEELEALSEAKAINGECSSQSHHQLHNIRGRRTSKDESTDEEEDDLRSNCSALTIETISENINKQNVADDLLDLYGKKIDRMHRTTLPSPMVPRDQVSIWSILKNCIGKELSKITMPVVFNEPLTMLQRACEGVQYSRYLKMANESEDPVERMELICAFIVAGLSANCHRIIKPFNPLLYETYEFDFELEDGTIVKTMAQQVSHHPPITAAYSESDHFLYNGSVNPKIKFWGRSIEVQPDGQCRIYLKAHNETYIFKSVSCLIHNIIVGKLWFEHRGPLDIKCVETGIQANLVFKQTGWFSDDLHRFDGFIVMGNEKLQEKKKLRFIYGKWSDYIKSVNYSEYENYMKENQHKLFRIPDSPDQSLSNGLISKLGSLKLSSSPNSMNNNNTSEDKACLNSTNISKTLSKAGNKKGDYNKSESTQSLDIPNSRTLWRLDTQYLEEYYNFTPFTMRLNELLPDMVDKLPKTDSRFRPDVRKLEEGDLDAAANEKQRLEEKQREARIRDKRFKDPSPDLLWFDLKNITNSKDKFWIYKGGYWESKCNSERFTDLF